MLERDLAVHDGEGRPALGGSGSCSSASRSAKTRSAEATPDCRRFAMLATWEIGWENWREYWMKAWTSPRESWPEATRSAADDRDEDIVDVADEGHRRLDQAGDELGFEARGVERRRCAWRRSPPRRGAGRTP